MRAENHGRILLNVALLKNLRKKRGLTQDHLAQDCRVNRLAISIASIKRAESGQKVLYRTALSLAQYYGVDIADIICASEARPVPPQNSISGVQALALVAGANTELQNRIPHTADNHCLIMLLAEAKITAERELKNYLRQLNIPFISDFPHIAVLIVLDDSDIEIGRHFKHLTRLLLTQFRQRIRICAHLVYTPRCTGQNLSPTDRVRALPDSVLKTMHQMLKLTAWDRVSACSGIAASGVCTPLSSAQDFFAAVKGWRYISVAQPYIDFVGRFWELSQIKSCHQSVKQSRQGITVYLDGMEGIGKTALIHRFIESINSESNNVVLVDLCHWYVARQPSLRHLIRKLLSLPAHASDANVRSQVDSSIPIALRIFIYVMSGIALRHSETRLLNAMDPEYRQIVINEALTALIDLRTANDPFVLIVEDMYLADTNFTNVIKLFAQLTQRKPLLLCITTRKSGKYSHRPDWLEHACTIELTGLTESQCTAIVESVAPVNMGDNPEYVRRACGHPGYLLQMLYANGCMYDFKVAVCVAIAHKLRRLDHADVVALKIVAVFDKPISLAQWSGITAQLLGDSFAIHTPQTLVNTGLLKYRSDSYAFQHPTIHEAILDCITRDEQRQIEQAIEQWKINWDIANEQAIGDSAQAHQNFMSCSAPGLPRQFTINDCARIPQQTIDRQPHSRNIEGYQINLAKIYDLMGMHEKIMEITEHISEVMPRSDIDAGWHTWAEMHAVRGSCRLYSGSLKEARVDYQQAVYCSKQIANPKTRVLALAGLAKCCYAQGRMQEAFENYHQCLKLCKDSELLSMEAEIRAMLASVHLFQLETAKAIDSGQEAVMLAHHTGNVRAELIARLGLSWVLLEVNAYQQARNEIREGLKLAYKARALRYIAFLLESKARLLWFTGAENKANIAINHALDIIKKQSLECFTGAWFSATKALISKQREDSYQALAQGEAWLQASSVAQNLVNFYSQGICTAWQLRDTGLLEKYHSRLQDYNADTPTQRAEMILSQADLMLNIINGTANAKALQKFNSRAAACNLLRLQFDLSML